MTDTDEIDRMKELAKKIIDGEAGFHRAWISENGWAVVPVVNRKAIDGSGIFFDEMEAERLACAVIENGSSMIIVISLDAGGSTRSVFGISADTQSIFDWSKSASGESHVLLSEHGRFAILCTSHFNIVGGKRAFVSRAVGSGILAARAEFYSEAIDMPTDTEGRRVRERMLRTAEHYSWANGDVVSEVQDGILLQRMHALMMSMVEHDVFIRGGWISQRGWIAVPFEKIGHISERLADRLERSIMNLGCTWCYAINTSETHVSGFEFVPDSESFLGFSRQGSIESYLVTTADGAFALLCTIEELNIIAGPEEFVESVLDCSVATAWRTFERVFLNPQLRPEDRRLADSMVQRYHRHLSDTHKS